MSLDKICYDSLFTLLAKDIKSQEKYSVWC